MLTGAIPGILKPTVGFISSTVSLFNGGMMVEGTVRVGVMGIVRWVAPHIAVAPHTKLIGDRIFLLVER